MNILYTNFHTHYGGGHDTYIKSLISFNPHCYVACPQSSTLFQSLSKEGYKNLIAMNFSSKLKQLKNIIKSVIQLKALIENLNIDLIHTNGSADNRMALYTKLICRKKFKVVFTKHNSHPAKGLFSRLRLTKFNDAVIFVSQSIFKTIGFNIDKKIFL